MTILITVVENSVDELSISIETAEGKICKIVQSKLVVT